MKLSKRLLKHSLTQSILAFILSLFIRFVYTTSFKSRYIHPNSEAFIRGEKNALFAFWHGRMMLLPAFCPPKRQMRVLISRHGDGTLISRAIGHFGQKTVSGSSSRGGDTAMREILSCLESGDNISITPDGPRGPFQVAAKGVITAAKLSGRPILPICFSSSRHVRMRSWDRFMLALPFGRVAFCVGAPIVIDKEGDEAADIAALAAFEHTMNELVAQADAHFV